MSSRSTDTWPRLKSIGLASDFDPKIGLAATYLAAYAFLHWVTYFLEYSDIGVTPWNPEAGLTFFIAMTWGWRALPLAFAAHLTGDLLTKQTFWTPLMVGNAAVYAASYAIAGSTARRLLAMVSRNSTSPLVIVIAVGGLASATAAVLRIGIIGLHSNLAFDRIAEATFTLATGDFIGILTLSPLLLQLKWREVSITRVLRWPMILGGIMIVSISFLIFAFPQIDQFKVFYPVFIPVIILALMYGFIGAALSILLSDISMMLIIYWMNVSVTTATELQVLMITLSATGLLLGSVVTDRRKFEMQLLESHQNLHQAQSALLHATRVSLVSEMASALAHELNQPLYATRNYVRAAQRLVSGNQSSKDIDDIIGKAVSQIDHASDLLRQIRKFLRKEEGRFERLDVKGIVATAVNIIEAEATARRVDLVVRLDTGSLFTLANSVQIQQVLLNLIRNALEAISDNASADRLITVAADPYSFFPGLIEVSVTDNGPGLSSESRANLFMPFTTSKEAGLGLGLSISRTIISNHGGDLWLDSSEPGHTRFAFTVRRIA